MINDKPKTYIKNGKFAIKAKALVIGHERIRLINQTFFGAYKLRAHAELPNCDYLNKVQVPKNLIFLRISLLTQGRPYGLKSLTQLCSACPSLRSEISSLSEGNLTLDEGSGGKKMKRKQIRTKEELINEIKTLAKLDTTYLNYSCLRKLKRHDLLFDAIKLFGGWRGAVKAAGFRPIQKSWAEDEIIQEIGKIKTRFGNIPPYKNLSLLGYPGLTTAAARRFGNWSKAVITAGHKLKYKKWDKNKIIKELKRTYNKIGHSPSMRDLKTLKRDDLLNAIIRHFKKYNLALKKSRLPIVLEMNKWSKLKVVSELKKMRRYLGKKPTRSEIVALGRYDLNMATLSIFGSWNKAMTAAGFTLNYDALNNNLGQKWENIVIAIASEIYPDSGAHIILPNRGIPDFYVFKEKIIIEAKINISENNVKGDTQRYLPYCRKLQIWYLYGIPPKNLSTKIECVGLDKIYNFIKSDPKLKKDFKTLMREVGYRDVKTDKPKKVLVLGSGAL